MISKLTKAVDLDWDRRDRGQRYLIVERGIGCRDGRDYVSTVGVIVGGGSTWRGAKWAATRLRRRAIAQHLHAIYDIVRRDEVNLGVSSAPYGC